MEEEFEDIKSEVLELAAKVAALPLFQTSKKLVNAEVCLRSVAEKMERVLGQRESYFEEVISYDSVHSSKSE